MMSDETYVALIRRAVAAFDPAAVTDANEIREHQGRVAYLARIDAEAAPVALTDEQLGAWLLAHGVDTDDLPALLDKYRGATEDQMDGFNDEQHGPMA